MAIQTILTDSAEDAAAVIRRGGLAAFPTETVYGLGASVYDEEALANIYEAKERPADNPLIAHVHTVNQIEHLTNSITPSARTLIEAFFPGPLTVVLERSNQVPATISAGLETIAIRMPEHTLAREFLQACEVAVAAPSANRSGRPSPTSWQDVYADLKGRIDCILKGDQSAVGLESTVVDCSESTPRVLRYGAITGEQLREVLPDIQMFDNFSGLEIRSPGMKYRHYAPIARVHMTEHPAEVPASPSIAYIGMTAHPYPEQLGLHLKCNSLAEYAHELYRFFRRSDRTNLEAIYCERIPRDGLGRALMDRIDKASASELQS